MQFPKGNDFYGVFVSAIDNPGHFWVQLLTEDSPHLDKLTNDLTELYSSSQSHAVLNAFKVSCQWYLLILFLACFKWWAIYWTGSSALCLTSKLEDQWIALCLASAIQPFQHG